MRTLRLPNRDDDPVQSMHRTWTRILVLDVLASNDESIIVQYYSVSSGKAS
jgi:hypothetical protein